MESGAAVSVTTAALIHVVVSGLATGSTYALMAISLVIVYLR
jgi:branched-subunit amino acid ABC-type transport system permease component